jgi:outer membrane protein assembly factor BamB
MGQSGLQNHLIAYNLTQKKEIYDVRVRTKNSSIENIPLLHQDKVYILYSDSLYCFNQNTGKSIWNKGFINELWQTPPVFIENTMIVHNTNQLFALNATTGTGVWNLQSMYGISNLVQLNSVLYFVADGQLQAIDIATGASIWKYQSPDLATNKNAIFQPILTADPITNRIYTASALNAMCFEAAR